MPGHNIILDAHSLAAVEVSSALADEFEANPDAFHIPGGLIGCRSTPKTELKTPTPTGMLVLLTTHACNLACKYCFVRNYQPDEVKTMSLDTAKRAVNYFFKDRKKGNRKNNRNMGIGFFGGEPMMNWKLIPEVVAFAQDFAKARDTSVTFSITTNATLIDEERAKFLAEHDFGVIISIDGPKELHNALRPAKRDIDSFDATMRGLRLLRDAYGKPDRLTVRGTYTGDAPKILERVQFGNKLIQEGLIAHLSVEPCSLTETACLKLPDGHPYAITPDKHQAIEDEYQRVAEWYVEELRAGRKPVFRHFQMHIDRLRYLKLSLSGCGAGHSYFSCGPDGVLYACHREGASEIGHLDYGLDDTKYAPWIDNRVCAKPACQNCPVKNACGGGCRIDCFESSGDLRGVDEKWCFVKRISIEKALWIMAEVSDELLDVVAPDKELATKNRRRQARARKAEQQARANKVKRQVPPPRDSGPKFSAPTVQKCGGVIGVCGATVAGIGRPTCDCNRGQ